jgi:pyruvate ferredoxin oxidoreductase beta subunit
MKVLGKNTCLGTPACCFAATTTVYPHSAIFVNNMISAFPALAATASGMAVAAEALGWDEDITILAFAGDGGTVDIGLQALSGAAERNDNILYICYDNEAYMNTGNQRSSSTPHLAWTTTTPIGSCSKGEQNKSRKNLLEIMMAHRVPYAATASVSYPLDYMKKVTKAKSIRGCKVLHVQAPCPTGWGYDTSKTIAIGRMAVECGLWRLAEYEDGQLRMSHVPKKLKAVKEYFQMQNRFRHLGEEDYRVIEAERDAESARIQGLC